MQVSTRVAPTGNLRKLILKNHYFQKKPQTYKPDSVPRRGRGLCHLSGAVHRCQLLRCLPSLLGAEAPLRTSRPHPETRETGFIWHFNPQGLPTPRVATGSRALLPHIFTLTALPRRLFSVALAVLPANRKPHPLGGAALCVVRTFLPAPKRGYRRQSGLWCFFTKNQI